MGAILRTLGVVLIILGITKLLLIAWATKGDSDDSV